jgi:LemA protein
MTSHWLVQLAVLAVLVFWVVGAYNRLMRLRNAVAAAWGQVEPALARRSEAMQEVVELVRDPLAAEAGTLQALADADLRTRQAAEAVRTGRSRPEEVSDWVAAEAALASPAARLRALIELQPALFQDAVRGARLGPALAAWIDAEPRIGFARQTFNEAVHAYNQALHQWPTRLITTVFGFTGAGRA